MLVAFDAAFLLLIPLSITVNTILSKMMGEPALDVWDLLTAFILLVAAFICFVCDYAKKNQFIE